MNTNPTQPEVTLDPAQPLAPEMTASPAQLTQPPIAAPAVEPVKQGTSEDTKTLVTVLLLIFVFPIGLIVMFFWPNWKWWVKLLVALPVLLFGFLFMAFVIIAINPKEQVERAECMTACQESGGTDCVEMCSVEPATELETESVMMDTEQVQ